MINEMYWLTRLGDIKEGMEVTFGISAFIAVCSLVGVFIACETPCVLKPLRRLLIASTISTLIGGVGYMLTPTAHEALMIYGYGAARDYYHSNDKLKQMPDKVVDYLDSILTKKDGEK